MTYKLINDNCFNWMKNREENSITAIVTDPPYGVKEYTEEELKKREMHLEVYGEFLQPLMAEKEVHCQDFLLSMTVHWKETMYIIFLLIGAGLPLRFSFLVDIFLLHLHLYYLT